MRGHRKRDKIGGYGADGLADAFRLIANHYRQLSIIKRQIINKLRGSGGGGNNFKTTITELLQKDR